MVAARENAAAEGFTSHQQIDPGNGIFEIFVRLSREANLQDAEWRDARSGAGGLDEGPEVAHASRRVLSSPHLPLRHAIPSWLLPTITQLSGWHQGRRVIIFCHHERNLASIAPPLLQHE
jgi:hypothetical protein